MSEPNSTKKCPACKNIKSWSDFYKSPNTKDGLQSECKVCLKKRSAEYQKSDKFKRWSAEYRRTDAGKLVNINAAKKYYKNNPVKRKAKAAIRREIKSGRLTAPDRCEQCDKIGIVQGHHDDYALLLNVRWLCYGCHNTWHTDNGPGLNG